MGASGPCSIARAWRRFLAWDTDAAVAGVFVTQVEDTLGVFDMNTDPAHRRRGAAVDAADARACRRSRTARTTTRSSCGRRRRGVPCTSRWASRSSTSIEVWTLGASDGGPGGRRHRLGPRSAGTNLQDRPIPGSRARFAPTSRLVVGRAGSVLLRPRSHIRATARRSPWPSSTRRIATSSDRPVRLRRSRRRRAPADQRRDPRPQRDLAVQPDRLRECRREGTGTEEDPRGRAPLRHRGRRGLGRQQGGLTRNGVPGRGRRATRARSGGARCR